MKRSIQEELLATLQWILVVLMIQNHFSLWLILPVSGYAALATIASIVFAVKDQLKVEAERL